MARWVGVMLLVVLAGCAGGGAVEETADQPDNELPAGSEYAPRYKSKTGGYVNGTDAAYYCDAIADSTVRVDLNRTLDGGEHSHDMWNGRDSIVIFEGLIDRFAGGNWFFMPGAVVYPGAGRAEFTLDWDPRPGIDDGRILRLDMPGDDMPGNPDAEMITLKFTKPGQTHSVDFGFKSNDRPHAERTSWSFKMAGSSAVGDQFPDTVPYSLVKGQMHERAAKVKWEIFREYDCLPVDPPHYDLWNGTTSRVVLDHEVQIDSTRTPVASSGVFYGVQHNHNLCRHGLPGNGTVPPGTVTMVVTLGWVSEEPTLNKLGLTYHGAEWSPCSNTRMWKAPPVVKDGPNERTYIIDVHALEADSPYAERSNWDFGFFFDELVHDDIDHFGKFKGTVTWRVEAFKAGYGP